MLADISGVQHFYIIPGYTDMRKAIDGLCAIIQYQLKMDPDSRSLYLFCGKRRDRIKAILKEPDGITLIYRCNALPFWHFGIQCSYGVDSCCLRATEI